MFLPPPDQSLRAGHAVLFVLQRSEARSGCRTGKGREAFVCSTPGLLAERARAILVSRRSRPSRL